jgi:type I restriction enzyme S subunit
MSEWKKATLQDVCSVITDGAHNSPKEVVGGYPMASVKDMTRHGIDLSDVKRISLDDFERLKKQGCMPLPGDVLIAKDGNSALDTVCIHKHEEEIVLLSSIAILRPNQEVCSGFLRYYLDAPQIRRMLKEGFRSGSAIPRVVLKDFRRAPIVYPPLREQQAIACILGALDDKIELNRRRCRTLEAMARAIFQSWFVDFDPVHHNARQRNSSSRRQHPSSRRQQPSSRRRESSGLAENYPSTGVDGSSADARVDGSNPDAGVDGSSADAHVNGSNPFRLSPEIAALFPDRFEDSPLGPIPAGWRVGTLGEVADNPRRGINADEIKPGTPYIALEHMPRRSIALADWTTADAIESNKFEFHQGEILFGKLRPYFHKVGIAPVDGVCSTDILVIVPRQPEWFGFCAGHFSSDAIIQHADRASTGTKMPRTNWNDLARFEVVIPRREVAELFSKQFKPMIDRLHQGIQESRTLAALRDALLPKLISGELRVPDAERIVGRAT